MRLAEYMNIRMNALEFDHKILTIHDGKGKKDRTLPMPESIISDILMQMEQVKKLHTKLIEAGLYRLLLTDKKKLNALWHFVNIALTPVSRCNI